MQTSIRRKSIGSLAIIVVAIMVILTIGLISSQDSGGTPVSSNPPGTVTSGQPEAQTVQPKETKDVTAHFPSLPEGQTANLEGLGEHSVDISSSEGITTVTGTGNFKLTFGEKTFTDFKEGETNTLKFDKNGVLTSGTEVTGAGDGEGSPTEVQVNGHVEKLEDGDKLKISPPSSEGEKEKIKVEHNSGIMHAPEKKEYSSEPDNPLENPDYEHDDYGKIVEHEFKDGKGTYIDSNNKVHGVEGKLYSNQDGIYHKQGEDVKFDKTSIQDSVNPEKQGEYTRLFTDSKEILKPTTNEQGAKFQAELPEGFKGPWAVIDKENNVLGVGTNNEYSSSVLVADDKNQILNMNFQDGQNRFIALQATGQDPKGSQTLVYQQEGHVPGKDMMGIGAKEDNDGFHYEIRQDTENGGRYDLFMDPKGPKLVDYKEMGFENPQDIQTIPERIRFFQADGENLNKGFEDKTVVDLYMDSYRRGVVIERDVNWEERGDIYQTNQEGYTYSPRAEYNYLSKQDVEKFNRLEPEAQKQFLQELKESPGRAKGILDEIQKIQVPETTDTTGASKGLEPKPPVVEKPGAPIPEPKPTTTEEPKPETPDWSNLANWGKDLPQNVRPTFQSLISKMMKGTQNVFDSGTARYDPKVNKYGVIAKVGATWCGPCKNADQPWKNYQSLYRSQHGNDIGFVELNIDTVPEAGPLSKTVPAYAYFRDGKVRVIEGASSPKAAIDTLIRNWGKN